MFEKNTFDNLLNRMLARVPSGIDKREGSIIYDALAPAAAELAQAYIQLDVVISEIFADTASRQYLILRAKQRGLKPYEATAAEVKGVFNCAVPIGSRYSLDEFNYTVAEKINESEHSYRLVCETAGSSANHKTGILVPIDYIEGLETATITEVLIPGEDEEDTEDFRKRYFESFNSEAFGGNRADYIKKVNEIQGVGGVKVYRAWKGGGTVKLVIISSEYGVPSSELVGKVQTAVDPTQNSGDGLGIAPIDHMVTVVAAAEQKINISTNITYASGWSFEETKPYIENVIDGYLKELNETWQNKDNLIVRVSQIESRILDLEGVLDIENTAINGTAGNYTVPADNVAVRGDINA